MMRVKHYVLSLLGLSFSILLNSQTIRAISRDERERPPASVPPEETWWNLLHYNIELTPDYNRKYITGTNSITFGTLKADSVMRIDLQAPMRITSITWKGKKLAIDHRKEDNYLVRLPTVLRVGEKQTISIQFEGQPREALKPPYDSGWIWAKDSTGRPFISIACEGSGASIWLPCKDVLYDEPDNGVLFSITVPDTLIAVSNGRLKNKTTALKGTSTYTWEVINPINNFNIIPYIGKYESWHETYPGLKGKLDCDYWVLDYNLARAKKHFKQTDSLLKAFEYWAGPHPFYEDGYKVVEAPMSGMEHQSALAYGNGFRNGLNGKDNISQSGWGLKFDFILVHESAHEWFGNSITTNNYGDGWIHEGFTKYFETLYTSYFFGTQAGNDYATGTWKRIKNDEPILGTNTSDKYYKASAMLHMIRQNIGDTLFRKLLTGLNQEFYHQTVNTDQILAFFNRFTKGNFTKLFDQYLTTVQIPAFSYILQGGTIRYRWENCIKDFTMPVKLSFDGKHYELIYPTTQWQSSKLPATGSTVPVVDRNYYITVKEHK